MRLKDFKTIINEVPASDDDLEIFITHDGPHISPNKLTKQVKISWEEPEKDIQHTIMQNKDAMVFMKELLDGEIPFSTKTVYTIVDF